MLQSHFQMDAVISLRVLFYLLTCTDFFGVQFNRESTHDVDILHFMSKNLDFSLVGRLLIKLTYIIDCNDVTVSRLSYFSYFTNYIPILFE